MAGKWAVADDTLKSVLQAFLDAIVDDDPWTIHLYKNDHDPVPGDDETDFTECDFPGYDAQDVDPAAFGTIVVAGHVATTTNANPNEFIAESGTWVPQIVYGYYLLDGSDAYLGAESFVSPRVINPDDALTVIPRLQEVNAPRPTESP